MLDKLADIEARYNELEQLMGDPEIAVDYEKVADYLPMAIRTAREVLR